MRNLIMFIAAVGLVACSEPLRNAGDVPRAAVAPHLSLELSDSAPAPNATIRVTIRATGASIASVTGRLAFDTNAIAFAGEGAVADGATRVVNPLSGVLRFAAIAPDSFAHGVIHQVALVVRDPAGLRTLRLSLDEAHTSAHLDVTHSLRTAP
jgi:hypothetical protein